MSRRVTVILILLFGAGLLLVWRPFSNDADGSNVTAKRMMRPDFTAFGLETRIFESDGLLAHKIKSEKMSHYNQIGLTELEQPVYTVFSEQGKEIWKVSSAQGTFYDDQTLILERDVEILALEPDTRIKQVLTEYLIIDLKNQSMSTEHPVSIHGPRLLIRGNGMSADLKAERMELKRHVKTIFQPAE
ncbi:MAG: LPS export ABC transporter periplasmic protein LptC [Idiomarina sp.]|nr:LPS export ABC transporter periplasmic protein LptC [Idiomarina sp.]